MSIGVVYIAFGDIHVREVVQSVATVRTHMPDIPITVYTDSNGSIDGANVTTRIPHAKYDRSVHMDCLREFPYDITLSLDTDTWICENLAPAFETMERFDIAGVHAPREPSRWAVESGIPSSFRTFNGGVLWLKKSGKTAEFLEYWKKLYELDQASPGDWLLTGSGDTRVTRNQPSLRKALYQSDARLLTLPGEYNFRVPGSGKVDGTIKILHGKAQLLPEVAKTINNRTDPRYCMVNGKGVAVRPRLFSLRIRKVLGW